ncbi:hypothetical protein JYU34_007877 [Plutella xylostella]|uniref:Uncharacterized protein n=1 Tax=Plutella xylostella TaxID=51655 RepID=A0ABQ7QRQ0_PLUXY|nr:hypothetical protein JYU34_007877 [Plutella xylostella]
MYGSARAGVRRVTQLWGGERPRGLDRNTAPPRPRPAPAPAAPAYVTRDVHCFTIIEKRRSYGIN